MNKLHLLGCAAAVALFAGTAGAADVSSSPAPALLPSAWDGYVEAYGDFYQGYPDYCCAWNGNELVAAAHVSRKVNEAFSFQIATDNQEETDKYWNAIISNGGSESVCGWCKDRWGVSWQISPRILTEAIASGGEIAKRAFYAMIEMKKIDISVIEKAILKGSK